VPAQFEPLCGVVGDKSLFHLLTSERGFEFTWACGPPMGMKVHC
jgi:hypothetical protein